MLFQPKCSSANPKARAAVEGVGGKCGESEGHRRTTADPSTHHPQAEKRLGPRSLRMTAGLVLRVSDSMP